MDGSWFLTPTVLHVYYFYSVFHVLLLRARRPVGPGSSRPDPGRRSVDVETRPLLTLRKGGGGVLRGTEGRGEKEEVGLGVEVGPRHYFSSTSFEMYSRLKVVKLT